MPQEIRDKISAAQKGKPKSAETRRKMSEAARRRCENVEYRKVLSQRLKQQWANPEQRALFVSATRRKRMSPHARSLVSAVSKACWRRPEYRQRMIDLQKSLPRTLDWRRKISAAQRGPKGPNWQGGKTEKSKAIRRSVQYRVWREAVFKRDNWTCQHCGTRGVEIHPHHLKSFADFPHLRLEISNGLTLCTPCHKQTDTYGRNRTIKKIA